jgi:hypothetical protein
VVVAAYMFQSPILLRLVCLSEVNFNILYFITLPHAISKLTVDGAEASKYVGVFELYLIFYIHAFVGINKK